MTIPDRGSATVWLLVLGLALGAACAVAAGVGAAAATRHRAAAAADAAALAGAMLTRSGEDQACAAARSMAAADGTRLVGCAVTGDVVTVSTLAPPPRWLGWLGPACGVARAGRITASEAEPPESGHRRNLGRSTSLCPMTNRRE